MDTLDDVKNHTYNELFVSGGFMVSDEFVLNPDLITQGKFDFSLWELREFMEMSVGRYFKRLCCFVQIVCRGC